MPNSLVPILPNVRPAQVMVTIMVAVLGAALSTGCNREMEADYHPIIVVPSDARRLSIDAATTNATLNSLRARLATAQPAWTVGSVVGRSGEQFGTIVDIATTSSGDVVVFDAAMAHLARYRDDGRFVATYRLESSGLGVLSSVTSMSVKENDEILVAYPRRIGKYSLTEESLTFVGTIVPPEAPLPLADGICTIDELVAVRLAGHGSDEIVMVLPPDGGEGRRFGSGYLASNSTLQFVLSRGSIACAAGGVIVIGFRNLPFVQGYSTGGDLLWRVYLDDFLPREHREFAPMGAEGVRFASDKVSDATVGVVALPGDAILVQTARYDKIQPGERSRRQLEMRSYLISAITGEGVYVGTSLPRILHANLEFLWAVQVDPEFHFQQLAKYVYK